jgi:hypothetical protein
MSDYYKTALGIVIDTMLPLALKHHVTQKVKLISVVTGLAPTGNVKCKMKNESGQSEIVSTTEAEILKLLKIHSDWVKIEALRESIKSIDLYHAIESLEKDNIIEVFSKA